MEITEILTNVKENWFQILTATGTVIALIFGTKKPNTDKKIKKLEKAQEKAKVKAINRQKKINELKGEKDNATSNERNTKND